MKRLLLLSAMVLAACSGDAPADPATGASVAEMPAAEAPAVEARLTLADTIAHPRRADDAARDRFRNPAETLAFFDVGPGQTVAEIWPGWYTPIIAPYLADNEGTYVAVLFPEGLTEGLDNRVQAFKDRYADTDTFGTIEYGSFIGGAVNDEPVPTALSLADNSVDTILTFRNVHNWMGRGYAEEAFSEFYRALKPGGTLGVVEHRLPETRVQDPRGASGYVQESYMKALAADAGFEFVESSDVNANPLDTADHPMGVWTLPPRSRLPEPGSADANGFDSELYKNIGESDRATLKFRKPE
ncbi:class I SAM-dependent methyltransferase [Algimonas porphyrae]|uniref:Methyltransferase n=1 Tax=Algimonas porphyrae TaxID=1128113 RepID=A0ABQ5V3D9_9PROT|nr:methyltransferase domain-containing protein [Algimonas porphyrae]GLQ21567.1 methyltransferase [Algimonas porphyrae]